MAARSGPNFAIGSDTVWERGYLRGYRTTPKFLLVGTRAVGWTGAAVHERYVETLTGAETVRQITDGWTAWARAFPDAEHLNGNLLIVGPDGLWTIDTLGAVVGHEDFAAIGAGAELATGALFYLRSMLLPSRVKYAVEAAIRYAVGCGGEAIVFDSTQTA